MLAHDFTPSPQGQGLGVEGKLLCESLPLRGRWQAGPEGGVI